MDNKKIMLGSLFIILSGLTYEFDKLLSYFKWAILTFPILNYSSGGYSVEPEKVPILSNFYTILFLLLGIMFLIIGIGLFNNKVKNKD